jgi:hypothetical protein
MPFFITHFSIHHSFLDSYIKADSAPNGSTGFWRETGARVQGGTVAQSHSTLAFGSIGGHVFVLLAFGTIGAQ